MPQSSLDSLQEVLGPRLVRRHWSPETSESFASLLGSIIANVTDGVLRLAINAPPACDPHPPSAPLRHDPLGAGDHDQGSQPEPRTAPQGGRSEGARP